MLGLPKDEWVATAKRTLIACGGSVKDAAHVLGMDYKALSGALNRGALAAWWIPYKTRLVAETTRARYRRAALRKRARRLVDAGCPPDRAEELAARRAPRGGWGPGFGAPQDD